MTNKEQLTELGVWAFVFAIQFVTFYFHIYPLLIINYIVVIATTIVAILVTIVKHNPYKDSNPENHISIKLDSALWIIFVVIYAVAGDLILTISSLILAILDIYGRIKAD